MKNIVCLLLAFSTIALTAYAQKVANYSYGTAGKPDHEQFSFWVNANKSLDIYYYYGADRKQVKAKFLGKSFLKKEPCFKVRITNNYILYIIPKGNQLHIQDTSGKYNKDFQWAYEGPVNGIGTFCTPCTEDESAAMKLLKLNYMK